MGVSRRNSILAQYKYAEADGAQAVFTSPFSGAYSLPELKFFGASFQASTPTVSAPAAIVSLEGLGSITHADQSVGAAVSISLSGIPLGTLIPASVSADPELMAGVWYDGSKYWLSDTDEPDVLVNGIWQRRLIRRMSQKMLTGTEEITNASAYNVFVCKLNGPNMSYQCRAIKCCSHGLNFFAPSSASGASIQFPKSLCGCITTSEFQSFLSAQYASGTPVVCQFVLKTPVVTLSAGKLSRRQGGKPLEHLRHFGRRNTCQIP